MVIVALPGGTMPAPVWTSDAIKDLRKRLGWTQLEMAHELHVGMTTIYRWEHAQATPRGFLAWALKELDERTAGPAAETDVSLESKSGPSGVNRKGR